MQELNKLIAYIGENKVITIDSIKSSVIQYNDISVEEWSLNVIAGNYVKASKLLKKIWNFASTGASDNSHHAPAQEYPQHQQNAPLQSSQHKDNAQSKDIYDIPAFLRRKQ
mgnify:CR=1 FL=1